MATPDPIDNQHGFLDEAVAEVKANADAWATLPVDRRIEILVAVKEALMRTADRWVELAVEHKGIPDGSPLAGEEWVSGPYALMSGCNGFIESLGKVEEKKVIGGLAVRRLSTGQAAVRVVPHSTWDRLLLSGITAEVWMQDGVSVDEIEEHAAASYDGDPRSRQGSVSLVLGAGNIASIAPLDCFQKLFVEHAVVVLKLNPVNDYLEPVFSDALRPLIEFGALRIVKGGADAGEYLCTHPDVESIHITGAGASHDAIVWGTGEEGAANRAAGTPRNNRKITSELGAVCPTIVVPGEWTKADLRYQAEHVATQKLHNSGFNCVACQVLILPADWQQKDAFLEELREVMRTAPARKLYYPGADDRLDSYIGKIGDVEQVSGESPEWRRYMAVCDAGALPDAASDEEVFAPVLTVIELDAPDAGSYLRKAIDYSNTELYGTLGANVIIDPRTRKKLGAEFEMIIADLKYGCIGINAWSGVGFLSVQTPWGAFPGHTLEDVQSGIGVVHNTFMLDSTERTVVDAPFRPFPRNLLHGSATLLPKPPWFITNRRAHKLGELLTKFQYRPSWLKLPRIFLNALRG